MTHGGIVSLANFVGIYYNVNRARQTLNGRRLPSDFGGCLFPSGKEGMHMVTYEALFMLLSLLVAVIAIVINMMNFIINITKKK